MATRRNLSAEKAESGPRTGASCNRRYARLNLLEFTSQANERMQARKLSAVVEKRKLHSFKAVEYPLLVSRF